VYDTIENKKYSVNTTFKKLYMKFKNLKYIFILTFSISICNPANGEILPDNTLGAETSTVTNLPLNNSSGLGLIDGGALRGNNLFHSFSKFNINEAQSVYFINPAGVTNILTRVTGGSASNILGTLGVGGNANLFLINPSGIIFGSNAQLDIQGSFVGTTAGAVKFGVQGSFSASNPETPGLLTINPSALLFNQINPQPIVSQATLTNQGASLMLVGGDVKLDEGKLVSQAGRIEIGAFQSGSVGLNQNTLQLDVGNDVLRGDIFIGNSSEVDLTSENGGNISIYARNLDISNSFILAKIPEEVSIDSNIGAKIDINATGNVKLNNGAVSNTVGIEFDSTSRGNGGDISISANSISLNEGSLISTLVLGKGNAGDINLNIANEIDLNNSQISSYLLPGGTGKAGNITTTSGSVFLKNGSGIGSSPFLSQGNSGNVNINARDIVIDGENAEGTPSRIVSTNLLSQGKGGDININTTSLFLLNGGIISSGNLFGIGDGGNINITAHDSVVLDGVGDFVLATNNDGNVRNKSGIDTSVTIRAEGKGGNININTGSLLVKNGGILNSSTQGKGDAGNIFINASKQVLFDGQSKYGDRSGAATAVTNTGEGRGGNISIAADTFAIQNTAGIFSSTLGKGGNSGDITINTRGDINFTNNGTLSTATFGLGNAGKVSIKSDGNIYFDQSSGIISGAVSFGRDIFNAAKQLGLIDVNLEQLPNLFTSDIGAANDIEINARSLKMDNESVIATITTSGNGGNIKLQLRDLLLLRRDTYFYVDDWLVITCFQIK
jgi:filamentous hemagglutinin family protein